MAGLTRQCRAGETFHIGEAVVRIVKIGRKATINIVAPREMKIVHHAGAAAVPDANDSSPLEPHFPSPATE